ncbi:MAG: helix-turn-helix domain-containing protein [bacterium]|nr:helix-turn-helix domain-containing protein [bacterium]
MDDTTHELLNVQHATRFLAMSVSTIRSWAQQKKLNGLKVGIRGDWRFMKEDLLKMTKGNNEKER